MLELFCLRTKGIGPGIYSEYPSASDLLTYPVRRRVQLSQPELFFAEQLASTEHWWLTKGLLKRAAAAAG